MAGVHEVLNLDDRLVVVCPVVADADQGRDDDAVGAFQIVRLALVEAAAAAAAAAAYLVVQRDCGDADERADCVLSEGHC